ncbi:hypothetical protein CC2G_004961 [Coprinopsis cinerea AmutBmut pab1-1]|nr:hypothetical protein CC2G_004961 [Coprinopsis cinerea AmutBmut pab1-1]
MAANLVNGNTATGSPNPSGSTTPVTPVPDSVFDDSVVSHRVQELLVQEGLYRPSVLSEDGKSVVEPASHDDPTVLRFLRARSFQPPEALAQFKRAEEWRKEQDVDNLFATGFTAEELETARRFYPRWTGRRDKQGLPLYVYRIAALESMQKELDAVPSKRRYQRIVILYEMMVRFMFGLCSHLPHPTSPHPISCTTNIIDLGDASFTSMFRLRGHFQEASRLATPYYPETLGTIIVVNAPSYFPTIWSWIKGWFDEGTRRKIHVLGKDAAPTLTELIHAKDLPKIYGGELEWTFFDQPNLDEDAKAVLPDGFPEGVASFKDGNVIRPGSRSR